MRRRSHGACKLNFIGPVALELAVLSYEQENTATEAVSNCHCHRSCLQLSLLEVAKTNKAVGSNKELNFHGQLEGCDFVVKPSFATWHPFRETAITCLWVSLTVLKDSPVELDRVAHTDTFQTELGCSCEDLSSRYILVAIARKRETCPGCSSASL